MLQDPNLYLIWVTNQEGSQYLVIESTSDVLTGGIDPKMGFFYLVSQRRALYNNIRNEAELRDADTTTANEYRFGTGLAATGWAVCAILSGSWCIPVAGLAAGAYWLSRGQDHKAKDHQVAIDSALNEIEDYERYMQGMFTIGQIEHDDNQERTLTMEELLKTKAVQTYQSAMYLLLWFAVSVAMLSFTTGRFLIGAIIFLIALILLYALIDGRVYRMLEERQKNPYPVVISSSVLLLLANESIYRDLNANTLFLLGDLQTFGLILLIRATGLIILAAFLALRLFSLLRHWVRLRK